MAIVEDVAFRLMNDCDSILLRAPSAFIKRKWLEMLRNAISKANTHRRPLTLSTRDNDDTSSKCSVCSDLTSNVTSETNSSTIYRR
jgi:hypothetical protein